ncbi:MAG: DUF4355 domain-containing protein [Ruminiclostridium sp.]|nr:DUF4355 domain-containing protein [Ruminiclostridium sp.]
MEEINEQTEATVTAEEEVFTKAQVDELMEKERADFEIKLKEAEKLAQMDAQQKADYRKKQAEDALRERELAVSKRELMADAIDRLTEYKLPKSLVHCVNLTSPEEYEKSIEGLKSAFSEAVTLAVNERIRGAAPKLAVTGGKDAFLDGLFE